MLTEVSLDVMPGLTGHVDLVMSCVPHSLLHLESLNVKLFRMNYTREMDLLLEVCSRV